MTADVAGEGQGRVAVKDVLATVPGGRADPAGSERSGWVMRRRAAVRAAVFLDTFGGGG